MTRTETTSDINTLIDALEIRSVEQPDETAYVILRDGETPDGSLAYGELRRAARERGDALAGLGLGAGDTVVLLYPSGLEFIVSLLGCMYAGVAAAPVQVPTRRRGLERVRRIADDADTGMLLTTAAIKQDLEERFGTVPEMSGLTLVDAASLPAPVPAVPRSRPRPDDVALLQYTSGSTGHPKGVIVTHANFLHNVAETEQLWPSGEDGVVVSWLPLFHDMGMLFGVILPICSGVTAYLMEPTAFVRRPLRWLEAISRYRGTHAAAPSFAYEHCVRAVEQAGGIETVVADGLDLSSWRAAVNGAEPVRWKTVQAFTDTLAPAGFAPQAMSPGYGLAENTLKATGSAPDREPSVLWVSSQALREGRVELRDPADPAAQPLVGCGSPAGGTQVRAVDPGTARPCPPGVIGELWITGPCVAGGYYRRPAETRETFHARLAAPEPATFEPGPPSQAGYLRTGDLGFFHDEELYIAGRLKDVIIRNGRNYHPQDLEFSAERSDPGLRPNCAAAFSVDDGEAERLVVVVEADGRVLRDPGEERLRDRISQAVQDAQRLWPDEIRIVRRGVLPRTSSGKVQRRACRDLYLSGALVPATAR